MGSGGAAAIAALATHYEAGSRRTPAYMYMTVSGGRVTVVRWKFWLPCSGADGYLASDVDTLNARIGHAGHFARKLSDSKDGRQTKISGTITGDTATVTVSVNEFVPHTPPCYKVRHFQAAVTARFH
jgi:hypothetical protein